MSQLYKKELNQIYGAIAKLPWYRVEVGVKQLRKLGWTDSQIADIFELDRGEFSRKFGKGRGK